MKLRPEKTMYIVKVFEPEYIMLQQVNSSSKVVLMGEGAFKEYTRLKIRGQIEESKPKK